jgi:hypothetical protein
LSVEIQNKTYSIMTGCYKPLDDMFQVNSNIIYMWCGTRDMTSKLLGFCILTIVWNSKNQKVQAPGNRMSPRDVTGE